LSGHNKNDLTLTGKGRFSKNEKTFTLFGKGLAYNGRRCQQSRGRFASRNDDFAV